jgi:SAM-dependent methyltransferase
MPEPLGLRLRRRLRWLAGRGWSAEDFSERYARGGNDAWGYRDSLKHRSRAEWIVAALPRERFGRALEVGCAQGFLSEYLAARVDHLIACDISSEAIRQARRAFPRIEFHVADIRDDFPADQLDLCLFSDVLYYLSPRENDAALDQAALKVTPGGFLMIVNEWNNSARGLTPPAHAFSRLDANAAWSRVTSQQKEVGGTALSMAIYRRELTPPPPPLERAYS